MKYSQADGWTNHNKPVDRAIVVGWLGLPLVEQMEFDCPNQEESLSPLTVKKVDHINRTITIG